MKSKLKYCSITILVFLLLAGCREIKDVAVEKLDCAHRTKLTIIAPAEHEMVTGLNLHIGGEIHGQATIIVTDDDSASRLERVEGKQDLNLSNEWQSDLFNIECIPDGGSVGTLEIFYQFESS